MAPKAPGHPQYCSSPSSYSGTYCEITLHFKDLSAVKRFIGGIDWVTETTRSIKWERGMVLTWIWSGRVKNTYKCIIWCGDVQIYLQFTWKGCAMIQITEVLINVSEGKNNAQSSNYVASCCRSMPSLCVTHPSQAGQCEKRQSVIGIQIVMSKSSSRMNTIRKFNYCTLINWHVNTLELFM